MNSLKVKILGIVFIFVVTTVLLTAWQNLSAQKEVVHQIASQNARMLGETVRNSIINAMASGENEQVMSILEEIRDDESITGIRIFDQTGRITLSADPAEIGGFVPSSALFSYRSGKDRVQVFKEESDSINTIVPIQNAPACHGCHSPELETLGVLDLHLSLLNLSLLEKEGGKKVIYSSLALLLVITIVISAFFILYVEVPIRKLVGAMEEVENGDFSAARIRMTSSSEMALLSGKFNLMVERLKDLIDTKLRQQKELAIQQEKLSHQDEIQSMNNTLEERLKEIEYLNISLEERIEEIEEANYKIADLAGDLEGKNTALEQSVSRLSAVYKIGLAINSTIEMDRLFELLVRRTKDAVNADIGYLLLMEDNSNQIRLRAPMGLPSQVKEGSTCELKPGGISYWVIKHQQPLLIRNMETSDEFNPQSLFGFVRKTVISAPLTIQGKVIGTLTMANRIDETSFTTDDLELLSTIAAQASVAINNARLYEEQQKTYLSTVRALVSAIEASDAYTRGHSERVTRYSLSIAEAMELPPETFNRLKQAAILHDIGKIGIDLALLHKEGKLSDSDVAQLEKHPLIGVKILEPIHFLDEVRQIIAQHHERFDGLGYPSRLAGDQIRLESRILAVADTYDAMTSDRPYRRALSHQIAVQEILDHEGTQFDPEVVSAFNTVQGDWYTAPGDPT